MEGSWEKDDGEQNELLEDEQSMGSGVMDDEDSYDGEDESEEEVKPKK